MDEFLNKLGRASISLKTPLHNSHRSSEPQRVNVIGRANPEAADLLGKIDWESKIWLQMPYLESLRLLPENYSSYLCLISHFYRSSNVNCLFILILSHSDKLFRVIKLLILIAPLPNNWFFKKDIFGYQMGFLSSCHCWRNFIQLPRVDTWVLWRL